MPQTSNGDPVANLSAEGEARYTLETVRVSTKDLRALVEERDHLYKQVKELQGSMTAMRLSTLYRQVGEFHTAFGLPVHHTPHVPPDERVRFRLRLITEEYKELLLAVFANAADAEWADFDSAHAAVEGAVSDLEELVKLAPIKVDLPEVADAMADLDYVVEGTRLEFGIYGKAVADEVHRANMTKLHPCSTCSGTGDAQPHGVAGMQDGPCSECKGAKRIAVRREHKVVKPEGWKPPDIEGALRKQGWSP